MKYALIDMGSNSIRLTVYEVDQQSFQVLFKEKLMAGLAGYVEQGRLTQDGINCACTSLQTFLDTLKLLGIDNLAVFATTSLRNITNTDQALLQIRQATGITVEILTGEEEAAYGFYGAVCDSEISGGLLPILAVPVRNLLPSQENPCTRLAVFRWDPCVCTGIV